MSFIETALVSTSEEMLVYQTMRHIDENQLQRLVDETLGPILYLPAKTRKKLIDTIEAMHHHSRPKAARILNVSTRTLVNRWNRIQQLTGLHLDQPRDRLRLDLALYALKILN